MTTGVQTTAVLPARDKPADNAGMADAYEDDFGERGAPGADREGCARSDRAFWLGLFVYSL